MEENMTKNDSNGQDPKKKKDEIFIPRPLPNFKVGDQPAPADKRKQASGDANKPASRGRSRTPRQNDPNKAKAENKLEATNKPDNGATAADAPKRAQQPRSRRPARNKPADPTQANAANQAAKPQQPVKSDAQQQNRNKGQNPENAGRAPITAGHSNRRRKAGTRRAEVGIDGTLRPLPHVSPQFNLAHLKSLGRHGDMVSLKTKTKAKTGQNTLKVIPLGGLSEIGKNMTVYEYGNDMIIVDVGVAFPEEYQPGIDSVIPDMSYVFQNKHKLRAVFLTHGHEDHIGSISWLLKEVDVPVYGLPLPIELVRYKLVDKGVRGRDKLLHTAKLGYANAVKAGVFKVEFINVNHSIADAASLAIHTPAGIAIHSGDFKVDYTPIHGAPIDVGRFAELGRQGVLLFMCESTNIEHEGFSPSEKVVGDIFASYFENATGRIIAATFASNVSRVQQLITAAERHNRKVALVGRSMLNVFRAAHQLGYIKIKADTLIDINQVQRYPDDQVAIITTGSQGESMSALTRMAYSEHRNIEIKPGDTIIISATPIPGNEKSIYRVINELYKRQATVIYSANADIHVSGHAYRGEIELLHQLIRPKYFIPGHGEYRHMAIHTEVANKLGQSWDSMYILNNGDIFECTKDSARIAGYTNAGAIMIDGSPSGTVDHEILDQRRSLSDDGVISISIAVDNKRNALAGTPVVQTRGFIYESDTQGLEIECVRRINTFAQKAENSKQPLEQMLKSNVLREQLQGLLYNKTMRRPVLLLSLIAVN